MNRRPVKIKRLNVHELAQKLTTRVICPKCSENFIIYANVAEVSDTEKDKDMNTIREIVGDDFPILLVKTREELSPTLKMRDHATEVSCPNCDSKISVKFIVQIDDETDKWHTSVIQESLV